MMPSQNAGSPSPTTGTARMMLSAIPLRRAAARTASGTAIRSVKTVPATSSQIVTGRLTLIRSTVELLYT